MAKKRVFLKGGTLIDGNGGEALAQSGILIEGNRIAKVGKVDSMSIPPDTQTVDVTGKTVMPGLIDAHVHLSGSRVSDPLARTFESEVVQMGRLLNDLPKLINAGFTSVRDIGSSLGVHVKRLMEEGEYKGPRIRTSYHTLSQTGGHGDKHMLPPEYSAGVCDGVPECMKAARNVFREGADFIKINSTGGVLSEKDDPKSSQFTIEEIEAIVYEAEAVGSFVASHAQGAQGIKTALKAGVRTIEHGIYIDDEGIDLMLKKSAILVPTLAIVQRIVDEGDKYGVPEYGLTKARRVYEDHKQNMKKAYEAGVTIALGSDYSSNNLTSLGENTLELRLLVDIVGMTPMEAIVAGTKNAAQALGMGDVIGTIEEGKLADILVVDGNPLDYISILLDKERIEKVFVDGEILKDN